MSKIGGVLTQALGCLWTLIVTVPFFAAWLQHLYTCFTQDRWGILIAGAICFPVGIVHGFGIWFGFWH